MHFDVGAWIGAADGGRAAGGTAAMLLHTGQRMIAGERRGVAGTGFRTCCTGTRGARRLHARKRVIAGKRRSVAGGNFRARGARRLHAGKRMIALNGIAGTGFRTLTRRRVAGRGSADVVALRRDRGDRRTRMRGNDAGAAQLGCVAGRRNGRMAVIVVERQRWIFCRNLHVLGLLPRRRHVMLAGGGNLLWRRMRRRVAPPVPPL